MEAAASLALVEQVYDALKAGDIERVVSLLTDDVVLVVPGPPGLGAAGTWTGHEGARECFRRLGAGHVTRSLEFLERIAEGGTVVSRLHVKAAAKSSGKVFESDIVHIFTVSDGKVSRLLDFFDTAALAEAYRA